MEIRRDPRSPRRSIITNSGLRLLAQWPYSRHAVRSPSEKGISHYATHVRDRATLGIYIKAAPRRRKGKPVPTRNMAAVCMEMTTPALPEPPPPLQLKCGYGNLICNPYELKMIVRLANNTNRDLIENSKRHIRAERSKQSALAKGKLGVPEEK